jgi:iron complex outermembrane receptor protein
MKTILTTAILIFTLVLNLSAQQKASIQILDHNDNSPIIGVSFIYGDQKGISDDNGFIQINVTNDRELIISHISYGKKVISADELSKAVSSGIIILKSKDVNLYPITVIALHSKTDERKILPLDYQDKMSHDGGAILTNTPVINVIRKAGNYGFDPVLRGFKYDQLNVVINGAVYSSAACPNRMDPATSQIAPNMTDRVEILKGPHALRYGNSFGGTINYVSSTPAFNEASDLYGRFSSGYESNGNIFRSEGMLGFNNETFNLGLYGSWSQGRNYSDGNGNQVASEFIRGSVGANLDINVSEHQQLGLSVTRNLARDTDFPALPMDLISDDTWLIGLNHTYYFEKGYFTSCKTQLYSSIVDHFMDNSRKVIEPRTVNAETDASTLNIGGRTETIWDFERSKLFAGLDFRYENADGLRDREFLMGPNAGKIIQDNVWQNGIISKAGLFAEYHLVYQKYRFILSGRLNINYSDLSDPADEFVNVYQGIDELQVNPSISVGGIRLFKNFELGLWLGRAQRSGSMTERFINYFPVGLDPYEMLGNPNIKPETNNQVDLTFLWNRAGGSFGIDLFTAYLQDMISSDIDTTLKPRMPTSPGVRRYTNIDNGLKMGFELNLSQKIFRNFQVQISMAYTYGQDLDKNEPLPEIAPLDIRYILTGNFFNNRLRPELVFRQVTEQTRISSEYGETRTPGFELLDFKLSYLFFNKIRLSAGILNIFDIDYYEHLSRSVKGSDGIRIYSPGRSIYASINIDLMN